MTKLIMSVDDELTEFENIYEPTDDDLQRCNCALAGELGHTQCGWNWDHNKPQYALGPVITSRGDSNADRKR